mgnify:CR=1 FL=1
MTGTVRLVPVNETNSAAIAALTLFPGQENLVASNAESLEEASTDPDARPRGVMLGDSLVGFLMYETPDDDGDARLYRLMIDHHFQGRGLGREALDAALQEISALPQVRQISICYEPENTPARTLYASAGFVEQGLDEDGEMIAILKLDRTALPRDEDELVTGINAAIASLSPEGLHIRCGRIGGDDQKWLLPAERETIRTTHERRLRESGAARNIARRLLNNLGFRSSAILRDRDSAPVWPPGIVGSLAHDDAFAIAAIAPATTFTSIGIDIEPAEPLTDDVQQLVTGPLDRIGDNADPIASKLVFSAKEAAYKAAFPASREVLGFEDVTIDLIARTATMRDGRIFRLAFITQPRIVVLAWA